jgi:glycosyltransferase involved in cell wall biosynthesis
MTTSDHRRLRVVHLVETLALGGMERVVQRLALETDAQRFEVQVVCLKAVGVVGDELRAAGIPVSCVEVSRDRPDYLGFVTIGRFLRGLRPDVVHTHNSPALIFGATGAWLAGVRRIVHTEHGRKFPDRLRYMVAERIASSVVNRVVGVTQEVTDALRRFEFIPARKLTTVVNGVAAPTPISATERSRVRTEDFQVDATQFVVGFAGRFVWEKDLPNLLQAWQRVLAAKPHAVLVLAGDGPERPAVEAAIAQLGIGPSIRLLGMRADVPRLLQAMDAFVMASKSEGLPLALLEAMAVGLPCVCTRVGGMPAALGDGEAGWIVPPSDPAALADRLEHVVTDAADRRRVAEAAARRFDAQYTSRAMVQAYQDLYDPRHG